MALSSIDYANKTYQYRRQVGAEDVASLAASLKENGQDIPIVLRRMQDGRTQIVCGFRRCTAAISLGWDKIRAITIPIEELPDTECRKLSARENIERGQYTALDKMFLCKKLSDQGVGNVEIGSIIGKSEAQVRRYIKVANAPADTHAKIESGEVSATEVGTAGARHNDEQIVDNTKYNVNSTRNIFEAKLKIAISPQSAATIDAFLAEVKKSWKSTLKQASKPAKKSTKSKSNNAAKSVPSTTTEPQPANPQDPVNQTQNITKMGQPPSEPDIGES